MADDRWAVRLAQTRRELEDSRLSPPLSDGFAPGSAAAENVAIEASRDAARDGFLGAYPLPPVAGVDDWWCSGPRYAIGDEDQIEGAYAPYERWGFPTTEVAREHTAIDDGDGWF